MNWFVFWLFLHILAAVLAFGPIFVFPIVGMMARKNPEHVHFAVQLNEKIARGLLIPLAGTMLISGTGLLFAAGINLTKTPSMGSAIVLYLVLMGLASGVMRPTLHKMAQMTETLPPADPPAFMALVKRAQLIGGAVQALFLVIIFLMIVQPGGITLR